MEERWVVSKYIENWNKSVGNYLIIILIKKWLVVCYFFGFLNKVILWFGCLVFIFFILKIKSYLIRIGEELCFRLKSEFLFLCGIIR